MHSCIVTGGSRGLGRAIALELGRHGWRVCVNYRSDEAAAQDTVSAIVASGGAALAYRADVRDSNSVQSMLDTICQKLGPPTMLVNNAGVTNDSLLTKMNVNDWDEVFSTNYRGTANCCRIAAPSMAAAGGGQIINIVSLSGLHGREGQCNYAAAKGALTGLTLALAVQLGPDNIRVNAVAPGYLPTSMGETSPEAAERAREAHALKRLGDIEETAKFIRMLAEMKSITGQVLRVDGRVAL